MAASDAETETTIVLADDHAVVRRGLRMLLDSEEGFEVLAEAGDVMAAIRHVRAHRPAVLVLEVTMPEGSTLPSIPTIKGASPETAIVVLTAADGQTYLHPQLGAKLAAEPADVTGPPTGLTEREVEILRLVALGHTNAEIGRQLYLSVRTVESHRAHIQQKIRRTSRSELARYALDNGLVDH